MKTRYLLLFVCSFLLAIPRGFTQDKEIEVIILHVNDMHSRIDNLAKLAYLKDSLVRENPLVFLVSAGDNFTGNPVVDMVSDKGAPMIDLMNHCGFEASAIGNHEFDMGQESLQRRTLQATFPFICGNMSVQGTAMAQPPAYVVLSKGPECQLVFLGLIQLGQNGLPDSHPMRLTGLGFIPAIDKVANYVYLKEKYGNLIGLTHLGVQGDVNLARQWPVFDLILGGHSHTVLDTPLIENGVMIAQAGYHLKWIGKTTLKLKSNKVVGRSDELIPVSALTKEKEEVRLMIDKYNDNEELNAVLIETPLLRGDAVLGSLMTDAYRFMLGTDFAFQNRGGIRIDEIPAGPLRLKDIYRLDPFGNQLVVYRMRLSEIKSLILNAYNMSKEIDLEVSGMRYTVVCNLEGVGVDVMLMDMQGLNLKEKEYHTVALNSYIASAYVFKHADPGDTRMQTTAQTLIDYLKQVKTIEPLDQPRTNVLVKK